MSRIITIVAGLASLPLMLGGLVIMFDPTSVLGRLALTPDGAAGLNTIRGMVGGFLVASALMIVVGIVRRAPVWFLAVAVLMAAATVGRGVGLVLDGVTPLSLRPFLVEAVIVGLMVVAYRSQKT